jgi:hypothetical protein
LATSWNSSDLKPTLQKEKLNHVVCTYEKNFRPIQPQCIALFTGYTKADTLTDIAFTGLMDKLLFQKNDINARITGYYQHNINELNGKISTYCLSILAQKSFSKRKHP